MKSFNKGGSFGGDRSRGRKDFGGRSKFSSSKPWEKKNRGFGDRDEVEMHSAVCGDCGNSCKVPFRPNNDKPVYCNDCFGGNKNSDRGSRNMKDSSFNRHGFGSKQGSGYSSSEKKQGDNGQMVKQFEAINTKLDKLVDIMNNFMIAQVKVTPEKEISEASVTAKKKIAAKKTPSIKKVVGKVVSKKAVKKAVTKKVSTKKK